MPSLFIRKGRKGPCKQSDRQIDLNLAKQTKGRRCFRGVSKLFNAAKMILTRKIGQEVKLFFNGIVILINLHLTFFFIYCRFADYSFSG